MTIVKLYYKIKVRLQDIFFKRAENIPTYEVKRSTLNKFREEFNLKILIETGTFMGETVEYFKNDFSHIYSIELSIDLANQAKEKFLNDDHISIIQGDSGEILKGLLAKIDQPVLFWLDGHYSSEFWVGDVFIKTARTNVDTPIVEELKTILEHPFDHVILIDDARMFTGNTDYPSIFQIERMVRNSNRKYSVKVENDIIRIIPNK